MKACEEVNDSSGDVILDLRDTSPPSTSSTSIPCSPWRVEHALVCFLAGNELNEIMIVQVQGRFDFRLRLVAHRPGRCRIASYYLNRSLKGFPSFSLFHHDTSSTAWNSSVDSVFRARWLSRRQGFRVQSFCGTFL